MSRLTITASEREIKAGARILRSLLHQEHPLVRRIVDQSLNELARNDAVRFTEVCEAAVLEQETTR